MWGELGFYIIPGYGMLYLCGESLGFIIFLDMDCSICVGRAVVLYYTWIWNALFIWGELGFYIIPGYGQLYLYGESWGFIL